MQLKSCDNEKSIVRLVKEKCKKKFAMKNVEMGFAKCTEKNSTIAQKKTKENATKAGKRKMLLN